MYSSMYANRTISKCEAQLKMYFSNVYNFQAHFMYIKANVWKDFGLVNKGMQIKINI